MPFHVPNNLKILIFGGALNSNCFRDKLITHLQKENIFLTIIPDKINYFDISSTNDSLVAKETRLFENSDILIIIPESPGSFAEIGMIASMINNPHDKIHKSKYAEKILIVLNEKYKHDESFLKLGPIKSIKHFGGKSININMESDDLDKIVKQFTTVKKPQLKHFNINNREYCGIFFANSIKILLYIYQHKTIKIEEKKYKSSFIQDLKQIHQGITSDNIEYLESTELIEKENTDGYIIINVRYEHAFIKNLIELNFNYFLKHNLIYNFLERSGY